jgi:N-acetylmuramoyl-L-alanine amidase
MENPERRVSWHYTVDDKVIIQNNSHEYATWNASDTDVNGDALSIEMCQNAGIDKDKMFQHTRHLVLTIKKMYPNIEVIKHEDVNGKKCPSIIKTEEEWKFVSGQQL